MRACLVTLVAVAMLLVSILGTRGAPATAEPTASQDVVQAASLTEEEETSAHATAHPPAPPHEIAPSAGAKRPHAFFGDAYDDGHLRRLFRPPNA